MKNNEEIFNFNSILHRDISCSLNVLYFVYNLERVREYNNNNNNKRRNMYSNVMQIGCDES